MVAVFVCGIAISGAVVFGVLLPNERPANALQFASATDVSGLNYTGRIPATATRGGGVYVTDYNRDQNPDVLLLGGTPYLTEHPDIPGQKPALYRNTGNGFQWSRALPRADFADRTVSGALFFDYDNDGWDDLLLLAIGSPPMLFENVNGTFERRPEAFNRSLDVPLGATAADYDGDGFLDVVVYQNGNWSQRTPIGYNTNGTVTGDNGNPNVLYWGNGSGFSRATDAGLTGTRWTLAATSADFTGDGRPDIYATNDYNSDRLYVNTGAGAFEERTLGEETNRNGMSAEVFDVNRDGGLDLFVTNVYFDRSNISSQYTRRYLQYVLGKRAEGNNLLLNSGGGQFRDAAEEYGVRKGGWGWAAVAADLDNDGDRDLLHATKRFSSGFLESTYSGSSPPAPLVYPALYERVGAHQFRAANASEFGFSASNGRGIARLDYNGDGDLDILVGQWGNRRYQLYRNRGSDGHWLRVTVEGAKTQTPVGTRVTLIDSGTTQVRTYTLRSDYQSQDARALHFGLGSNTTIDRLEIQWPDGQRRILRDLAADQHLVVTYPSPQNRSTEPRSPPDGRETAP